MGIENQTAKNNTDPVQISDNEGESKVVASLLPYTLTSKGWRTFNLHEGMLLENPKVKGKLIRTESLKRAGEEYCDADLEINAHHYKIFKDVVDEARRYGIKFPSLDILFGKVSEDKVESAFLVVDRIKGKKLFEIKPQQISKELVDEVTEFCKSVAKYIQNCWQSPYWLQDNRLKQVIWGHKMGEKENHLYDVDLEIGTMISTNQIKEWDRQADAENDTNLTIARLELRILLSELHSYEKKWGVNFSDAKQAIIDSYRVITNGKVPKGDMEINPVNIRNFLFPEDTE